MHLVVLAAGFATRMYPLTKDQPKPLLEVGGQTILDRVLDQFRATGCIDSATVVVNRKFAPHFERWHAQHTRLEGLPVELVDDGVVDDTKNLGALRDLQLVLARRRGEHGDFVVSGGDNIFAFPLRPFFQLFASERGTVLPVRRLQEALKPKTYGEVEFDRATGRVTKLREKPADPTSRFAAFCLYFFPAQASGWLDEYLASGGNGDAPGYFLEWLATRQPILAKEIEGRWYDIGSLDTLERARRELR